MESKNKFTFEFNTKCDTCQKIFKMVAVQENEKLCLDCSKAKFSINYKLNPDDFELDKNSEKRVDKVVEEVVKIIKKENENK